jgi:hypothetical protein
LTPTATWVQAILPSLLAKAFAAHMAPDEADGATLSVAISSVTLGTVGGAAGVIDRMNGTAALNGGGADPDSVALSAITTYVPSPIDQNLGQQATEGRVEALARSFSEWLPRKFDMGDH